MTLRNEGWSHRWLEGRIISSTTAPAAHFHSATASYTHDRTLTDGASE